MGVGVMGHLQMTNAKATNSHAKGESTSGQGDNNERESSRTMASNSPRCSFHWLHKALEEQLAAWSSEDLDDMDYDHH